MLAITKYKDIVWRNSHIRLTPIVATEELIGAPSLIVTW